MILSLNIDSLAFFRSSAGSQSPRSPLAFIVALALVGTVALPRAATTQTARATALTSLTGHVADQSGAPIAGARITVSPSDTGTPSTMLTDAGGNFRLALEPGRYSVAVSSDGFRDVSTIVTLRNGRLSTLDVVLPVAGVHEAVSVTASPSDPVHAIRTATKTITALRDVPQSVTIVTRELIDEQMMMSVGDAMRYVPGVAVHQGENNRDQLIMRGNSTSADFFVDGVRDDVQYYRDLYNLSRIEVLKGPNALMFGRGGAGGVVNRVGKEALFQPLGEVSFQAGMFGLARVTADLDRPLGKRVAFRLNGMFEDSDSFRQYVGLRRYGVTPTVTFLPGSATKIVARYEYARDHRVADRGIPSFGGSPVNVEPSTYYGNPADSRVDARAHRGSFTIEHAAGPFTVRNHTSIANHDRGYQNFVPGAVSGDRSHLALTAYNNATARTNLFNQTDVTLERNAWRLRHRVLVGAEMGRQLTDNFRNTGFFGDTATSIVVPMTTPTIAVPVTFRQSASDADNHVRTNLGAIYAQDQIEITPQVQVVSGLRFDRFGLRYHDNRSGLDLARADAVMSPRVGLVATPVTRLSAYTSYSVSFLPSAGDQFSSLTLVTQQLKPETFINYEVGAKLDLPSGLALTMAVYRLDRMNTRAADPNDSTRIVQTGSQRTNGYELGLNGSMAARWQIAGGYAYENAYVTSATLSARTGAEVGQVPHHALSLWNTYRVHSRISAGLGVLYRSDMFAAIDDSVTLAGYTRADAALFLTVTKKTRLQVNVENLFDARYVVNADSNTNISPGSPRAVRLGLTRRF